MLRRLLQAPVRPVTVVTHKKRHYDADDMKVALDGQRLMRIGKDLPVDKVDGESIGMILFRREGPAMFRQAVETALCDPAATKKWYLSGIDEMAQSLPIWTCAANGLQWCEVDFPADLKNARNVVRACDNGFEINAYPQNRYAWG